jgi:hypothetical protein
MGLDMYAWRVKSEHALGDFEIARKDDDSGSEVDELFYWRKHHDLHGWMEALYRDKGGDAESFNCVKVRLTKEDLDRLIGDIANRRLPRTEGFFFGNNPPDYDSMANDMKFVALAMEAIQAGDAVYYDSWW